MLSQKFIINDHSTGETITVTVNIDTSTVYDVKSQISNKEGIPAEIIRLVHNGKEMIHDYSNFKDQIINNGAIHMVLRHTSARQVDP
jgi:uncharacterized membrane protein